MTVAVLAAAVLLSACGRSEERDVRKALERYAEATERKDYQALCDEVFAEELIDNLRRVGAPCEIALKRGLKDVQDPTVEVESVKIEGDTATAVARTGAVGEEPSRDTIKLVKQDGLWKILDLTSS
jgi:ketosteroid isomerase-like protein